MSAKLLHPAVSRSLLIKEKPPVFISEKAKWIAGGGGGGRCDKARVCLKGSSGDSLLQNHFTENRIKRIFLPFHLFC